MRNFLSGLLFLTAVNLSTGPAQAADAGWRIDQNTNAHGNIQINITAHAMEINIPAQKYKLYSFAPNWNVVFINGRVGTYIDFPYDQFMGSMLGRLGSQLGNDIQMLALPKPNLVKEDGLEFAVYDYTIRPTQEEKKQLLIKNSNTVLYSARSIKAKYMRLPDIPKQIRVLACKITCVPMSSDLPLSFSCLDGFKQHLAVLTTTLKRREKAVTITQPDLKKLKRVKTETELFSRNSVSDVFELFDDSGDEKKPKR